MFFLTMAAASRMMRIKVARLSEPWRMFVHVIKWTVVLEVDIIQGVRNKSPRMGQFSRMEGIKRTSDTLSLLFLGTDSFFSVISYKAYYLEPNHLAKETHVGEALCHPRCRMCFQLRLIS